MKNRGKFNLVVDFTMFLFILAIFSVKGGIHEALAYTLGGLLILHIVLHWKQIKVLYRQLIPQSRYQYLFGFLAAAAVVAVLTMSLHVNGDGHGYNRNGHGNNGYGHGYYGDGQYEQGSSPGYDKGF